MNAAHLVAVGIAGPVRLTLAIAVEHGLLRRSSHAQQRHALGLQRHMQQVKTARLKTI